MDPLEALMKILKKKMIMSVKKQRNHMLSLISRLCQDPARFLVNMKQQII